VRLAKQITDRFGITPQLIPGRGGIFDVIVDGQMVFSKFETDSFPDEAQLLEQLAKR
jgi:selT/selW/selH-like putative selenoprotein